MININFVELEDRHLPLLYEWRTSERVSKFQLSKMSGSFEEHIAWFKRVSLDPASEYWIIEYADRPIGLFNLAGMDQISKKLTAGFYIGAFEYLSIGALIPPFFYNYIFFDLKFNKIWGEVFWDNINVRKIHQFHGFREVGVFRDHVLKDDKFHNIVLIELLSDSWLSLKKYHKYRSNFLKVKNVKY
ncbi:UDP-4-amino-4,6-dideoxy-N-acetyl-beta-L-altrosamine N-acetyltransferase [Polynucleobacter bastaniensis]|uniref:UDP-4-amino-4, 6-dideoxy-N-acetyl-beta-L-altrosamine N-acetyltransferase n=1 Tax=Polynucleobacter bastaniensis TaxID=2081039 RepID=UPI001C0C10D8|nr:UDP-4-amino-4,6-dideoxy-N-acetyl-beta-L-altrosamine N-acetyltransferase [Polynucleobacter bastaniensis]MBU3597331.1 UDP-4-amino-4,6-dideoxy-N-acetyl-beta-L-altrosamine N-acetyltransferase [Polynucleobacter bastaniensis]